MLPGSPPPPYAHLDARLQQLPGAALHFWGDAAVRRAALQEILDAYTAGDTVRLDAALSAVDDAVVAGMQALGFDRAPINGLRFRRLSSLGQKRPTCHIELDVLQARRALTVPSRPDSIVETWIHESIHARRRPWAADYVAEQHGWVGYEEGLAEGLTGFVARRGGLTRGRQAYRRYCRAYELLAETMQVEVEQIYVRLWPNEPGALRRAFTDIVDDLYHRHRGRSLSLQDRMAVLAAADTMFASHMEHQYDRGIERDMRRAWQECLQ